MFVMESQDRGDLGLGEPPGTVRSMVRGTWPLCSLTRP
jgi:hypothetical protein